MKSEIRFYFAVFVRRLHYFLVVFVLVSAASLTIANILPPIYQSRARLLVESSQIPAALAAPTVRTGGPESLEIIEQRLMTRVNLLEIARSQNVFPDMSTMSADMIVRKMRENTRIRRTAGRDRATMMLISFTANRGPVAANVVNRYVTLILQDNVELRTDRAGDTLQFFDIEVARLGADLERQGAIILSFKNKNTGALPESLDFRMNRRSALQQRIASIEREIDILKEQKRRLVQVFEATGRVGTNPNANLSPEQRQLASLQDQLRTALAVYSLENPKVRLIKAQVAQLEAVVAGQPTDTTEDKSPQASMLDIQLADIDSRAELLGEERDQAEEQVEKLRESIERTPANSITLQALQRDYQNVQQQYNTAVRRQAQAATGERIELLAKGQRIAVLDPATAPSRPNSPNRAMIGFGGMVGGAFLGIALIAVMEFLNSSIRRPADIIRLLGITPIVTVPYIRTPMELVMRRAVFVLVFFILVIGLPTALFAVHTYYMPLDLIYERVAGTIRSML